MLPFIPCSRCLFVRSTGFDLPPQDEVVFVKYVFGAILQPMVELVCWLMSLLCARLLHGDPKLLSITGKNNRCWVTTTAPNISCT